MLSFSIANAATRPAPVCRWLLWWAWQKHLQRLHAVLQDLQPRICLALAFRRWQLAIWAAQADDASLCHRAVQLPRAFGAWRGQAQAQAQLRRMGDECWLGLLQKRRRAVLAAWRRWAAGKWAARAQQQAAEAHFVACSAHAALHVWRLAAATKAARRQRQEQAAAHWAQRRLALVFARWLRWACQRRRAPDARPLYLLRRTFGAWRQETARKAGKAARLRLAVRQHYLRQLWAGWAAWRQHCERRGQKQQHLEAMRQYRGAVLLRQYLAAWHGPFLASARSKRAAAQLAERHAACQLLRQAVAAWCGPFMLQARQQQALQLRADKFRAAILLRSALVGWGLWCMQREEKRQQLERQQLVTARLLLRPGHLRRLLLAWRSVCASKARLRWQVS